MDDREFRFETGATWLDFLSTLHGRRRPDTFDRLTDPRRLGEWLTVVGLRPRSAPGPDDLDFARTTRETLYRLARATAGGTAPDRGTVAAVNDLLATDEPARVSVRGGVLAPARPRDTRAALARLARQAVDQLGGPNPPRLRACGDDTCAGVFIDDTGRRRWCNDARCGSRVRVQAHRARARGSA